MIPKTLVLVLCTMFICSVNGHGPTDDHIRDILSGGWKQFKNFTGCRSGDHVDGLAKLKQYFNRFGYILNTASNFTDDFDDLLEAAIRDYQLNFNLNQTGTLDESTLDQIQRPRCGNADIVNGTSSMNSGHKNVSSMFHSVQHYSFFPGTPRWSSRKRDLTYAFLPENNISSTAKLVFERAFARWSEVIPLTFTETDNYDYADLTIGFYTGDHGDGELFDGVLGTLAHAFSPPDGRFHLDGDETWVETWVVGDISASSIASAVDLESVAVHEIGHLLGMGHSSVPDAIMYPTISSMTRKVELASDDIEGVQTLYGSNPSYNGTSEYTTSSEDNGTSDGIMVGYTWRMSILTVIGLLAVILL